MTYKKPLKAFTATTLMGLSAQATDTADGKRIGSNAIDAFKAHKTITAEDDGKKILVPFHAVKTAMYGTRTEDAEKADAYCGGGTEPVGEVWYTGTLGECQGGYKSAVSVNETDKANTADLQANPTDYIVAMNGTTLQYWAQGSVDGLVAFVDDEVAQNYILSVGYIDGNFECYGSVKCPTDITTIEVTVAHK